jgi:hypothetical protein
MWLSDITEPTIILENEKEDQAWGRKLYFAYQKAKEMSQPDPIVFYLGLWRMTDKKGNKKKFLCGINLAALSSKQELVDLQENLPEILEPNNTKDRYDIGKLLVPHIFRKAYRTYNVKNIASRPLFGRLRALKATDQDIEQARREAVKDSRPDWNTLSKAEQEEEYGKNAEKVWKELPVVKRDRKVEKEISKRGEEDLDRIERAQEERDSIENVYHDLQAQREKEELEDDEDFEFELGPIDVEEPGAEEYPKYNRPSQKKMEPLSPGPGVDLTNNQIDLTNDQVGLPTIRKPNEPR